MKTIEFVSKDIDELQAAEDFLLAQGFKVQDGWTVKSGLGELESLPSMPKKVVRYGNGWVNAHNHTGKTHAERHVTLSGFKQAILDDMDDMETTTKTKEGKKVDYKDICIEFDTDEQAQAFAEAVHKNGHKINFWESKFYGSTIGISRASGVFSRHSSSVTRHSHCKHISEAPAEWLRFLLSPVKPALKIAGHDVRITAETAKIGCTTVTWEEVKSVYKAMKGARG